MNYGIRFFFLMFIALNSNASTLRISYFSLETKTYANSLKRYLSHKYQIPDEIIGIEKEKTSCNSNYRKLCLNKKGELNQLSSKDIIFFKKSFLVFSQRTKNEL